MAKGRRGGILFVVAAALALSGPGGGAAARLAAGELPRDRDGWIQVKSANFLLFSDAGERRTRKVAEDLEEVRSTLGQLSPHLVLTAPCPTFIYVFKNGPAFARYMFEFQGKRDEDTAGYFVAAPWGNYMAIDGDPRADAVRIIRHEYLHYLLHNNYRRLPLWLDEGLAEYYGTLGRTGERVRVGLPIAEHIGWLRANNMLPLPQLFAVERDSKDYHEGIRRGVFYAESWALTHYLLVGNPARRPQVAQLARLIEAGVPQEKAFAQAFAGDYEALERELRVYVSKNVFPYQELPIAGAGAFGATVQPLATADLLYRLGDLLLTIGPEHPGRAAEHFQAALAANPRHGLATAGLGEIDERAGRRREARERFEKAVQLAPDEPIAHFLLGRFLLAPGGEHAAEAEGQRAAAAELERATALAPDFGEAWAMLAAARVSLDPASPQAMAAWEAAHRLLPQRTDLTLNLALSYAWNGQRPKADALIERARAAHASTQDLASAKQGIQQADHHRFVAAYNQAVALANAGDGEAAIGRLEALLAATVNAADQAEARKLLDSLKAKRPEHRR